MGRGLSGRSGVGSLWHRVLGQRALGHWAGHLAGHWARHWDRGTEGEALGERALGGRRQWGLQGC
jgi:hypothetical protein